MSNKLKNKKKTAKPKEWKPWVASAEETVKCTEMFEKLILFGNPFVSSSYFSGVRPELDEDE